MGVVIYIEREREEKEARETREGRRGEESEDSNRISISTLSSQPRVDKHIEFGTQFAYRNAVANSSCLAKRGVGVRGWVLSERERRKRRERQERAREERRARGASAFR